MATITATPEAVDVPDDVIGSGKPPKRFVWPEVTEADTAAPITIIGFVKAMVVQFAGTFGGATATFEGSIDGTTDVTLTDVTGAAISLTADGVRSVIDKNFLTFNPAFSGGSSQDVDITLLVWTE